MSHDPLDNVVWAALTTAHADLALGRGLARHYPRDVAPFAAIAEPTAAAHADLAADLPPGQEARLFRPTDEATPPGWTALSARPVVQMVFARGRVDTPDDARVVGLGSDDLGAMLTLAELAKPGPFAARTPALGGYLGMRDRNGALVGMAGERFRLPGHVEISAVAVDPAARGQGLGKALVMALARRALARGELPFLHVFPDNPAMPLYARWGFRERARPWVIWRRPTSGR